jgi:hypothetical protein
MILGVPGFDPLGSPLGRVQQLIDGWTLDACKGDVAVGGNSL